MKLSLLGEIIIIIVVKMLLSLSLLSLSLSFAFVEFANPESVQVALQYNGAMFGDRPIK